MNTPYFCLVNPWYKYVGHFSHLNREISILFNVPDSLLGVFLMPCGVKNLIFLKNKKAITCRKIYILDVVCSSNSRWGGFFF